MSSPSTSTPSSHREYWNDERFERSKPYWVERADDRRLLDYLQIDTNLQRCFEAALHYAEHRFGAVRGTVLDLGAGVGWTTALVSRWPAVDLVWAVDYSEHRLMQIAPIVFQQFEADTAKIMRHCGDMTTAPALIEAVDLVIFCQALYMCGNPIELLRSVRRQLKPGGVVIVSCERVEAYARWKTLRRLLGSLRCRPLREWPRVVRRELPDASGRYPYVDRDYRRFLSEAGFAFERDELSYPLFPGLSRPAVNYFGVNKS